MAAHKEKRKEAIKETKQNLILDAALDVFSVKGFHDARLEDIAEHAGFSKASLYNYYPDKETIFINVMVRDIELLMSAVRSGLDPRSSLYEKIHTVVRQTLTFMESKLSFLLGTSREPVLQILGNRKIREKSPDLLKKMKSFMDSQNSFIADLLRPHQKNGEIGTEFSLAELSEFFGSLLRGVGFQWKHNGVANVEQTIEHVTGFFLRGAGYTKMSIASERK